MVKPTAALAYAGDGEFCSGDWCRFCPAGAQCSARARKMLELEPVKGAVPETLDYGPEDKLLTDAEIGDVLTRGRELVAWIKDLEDYALSAALAGREISGYKVVEGRGSREWADVDAAFAALQQRGVAEAMLWERKPTTVAGLEKAMGKKAFAETATDLVVKKPGKPALVPASDKRPAYNAAAMAFGVVSADG